ncbi:MAG: dicarboxylate/amino acid:cation symporter [Bacteroidetes bacterium]|nr:dicarboxylate/amino acid:cation symporter [Bacteroidota bacterium]
MKRIKLPKLHHQILAALILGAIFGSIFNVNKDKLVISFLSGNSIKTATVKGWEQFSFIIPGQADTVKFGKTQQQEIISYHSKLKKESKSFKILISGIPLPEDKAVNRIQTFSNVVSISKEGAISTDIKWIGDIFIRLLSMIAIPLVFASLTVGAASLGDIRKFARIGGKTISYYLITTVIAITIGLVLANLVKPGERMSVDTKKRMLSTYTEDASSKIENLGSYDIKQQIVNIIPRNPIKAFTDGDMLQIIFFSVFLGLILSLISKEKASPLIKFFDGLSDSMIKMVDVIMLMAPIGVFALISATVGEFGFDILQTLIWYAAVVIVGLMIHTFGVYPILLRIFSKIKTITFFKGIRRVQTIAFSTSSSAATLPVNMECCQENLGVSKSITSFVLPLGATINMDGTALYQGVAAVFIAQVFGIDLNFTQQITIIITATLASIGTAPVPGVGIIMLIIILKSVGIPEEGIALIMGVDRILDMCRTITNVTGDAAGAVIIASSEKEILHPDLSNA